MPDEIRPLKNAKLSNRTKLGMLTIIKNEIKHFHTNNLYFLFFEVPFSIKKTISYPFIRNKAIKTQGVTV